MVPRQMRCHSVKPPHYECMCEARLDELAPLCTSSEDVLFSHASLVPESPCWFHLDGVFFLSENGRDVFNLDLLISVLETTK